MKLLVKIHAFDGDVRAKRSPHYSTLVLMAPMISVSCSETNVTTRPTKPCFTGIVLSSA